MPENFYQQTATAPQTTFDVSLRPPAFSEFIGQEKVKERLILMVDAAKLRGDVLTHVLLSGPPGLGKTTLANIVSQAVGSTLHTTSGPQIEKAGDLAGILTNLEKGDVLFIDEIHRLARLFAGQVAQGQELAIGQTQRRGPVIFVPLEPSRSTMRGPGRALVERGSKRVLLARGRTGGRIGADMMSFQDRQPPRGTRQLPVTPLCASNGDLSVTQATKPRTTVRTASP